MSARACIAPTLAFAALGTPAPQGSKRHVGNGRMVESSKTLAPWRDTIVHAARTAMPDDWQPLDGPVRLIAWFSLPRPKSAPKHVRLPAKKPDLDKLLRAVLDACTTAGVWHDDAQVVKVEAGKSFAGDGSYTAALDVPGVVVLATTLQINEWAYVPYVMDAHRKGLGLVQEATDG